MSELMVHTAQQLGPVREDLVRALGGPALASESYRFLMRSLVGQKFLQTEAGAEDELKVKKFVAETGGGAEREAAIRSLYEVKQVPGIWFRPEARFKFDFRHSQAADFRKAFKRAQKSTELSPQEGNKLSEDLRRLKLDMSAHVLTLVYPGEISDKAAREFASTISFEFNPTNGAPARSVERSKLGDFLAAFQQEQDADAWRKLTTLCHSRGMGHLVDWFRAKNISVTEQQVQLSDGEGSSVDQALSKVIRRQVVTAVGFKERESSFPTALSGGCIFFGEGIGEEQFQPLLHEAVENVLVNRLLGVNRGKERPKYLLSSCKFQDLVEMGYTEFFVEAVVAIGGKALGLNDEEIRAGKVRAMSNLFDASLAEERRSIQIAPFASIPFTVPVAVRIDARLAGISPHRQQFKSLCAEHELVMVREVGKLSASDMQAPDLETRIPERCFDLLMEAVKQNAALKDTVLADPIRFLEKVGLVVKSTFNL